MSTNQRSDPIRIEGQGDLSARTEEFDSFWEGPSDVEKGYRTFGKFYRSNYGGRLPADREANILVTSCGPGYFVNVLHQMGYANVVGVDSRPDKVEWARRHGLNCRPGGAFAELQTAAAPFDLIFCEQELNHLTKEEMVEFLRLAWSKLNPGGRIICHGLNGSNPIVGAETLAQNFDHFNTFTSYSLQQVLEHTGFERTEVFGLHLYVFYGNPLNYMAWGVSSLLSFLFRGLFLMYGKSNKIFHKKIGAVAFKPDPSPR